MKELIKTTATRGRMDQKGLSILDVLLAASLLAVGILAVATMQVTAIKGNTTSRDLTLATNWAQDWMEQIMALPYSAEPLNLGNHTEGSPPAGCTITWTVTSGTVTDTKNISVRVQWQNQGRSKSLTITNVRALL